MSARYEIRYKQCRFGKFFGAFVVDTWENERFVGGHPTDTELVERFLKTLNEGNWYL